MGDAGVGNQELEDDMEASFEKRYGWYVILNRLADNKISAHNEIFDKKIIEALNQLVYLIAYDKEQLRLYKEAQKKG
jgi:hypothetical protein